MPNLHNCSGELQALPYAVNQFDRLICRPLAKDGVNRSFAALYDGQNSPDAAQDAAVRLHLILQRENALVAKNSGTHTLQLRFNTNYRVSMEPSSAATHLSSHAPPPKWAEMLIHACSTAMLQTHAAASRSMPQKTYTAAMSIVGHEYSSVTASLQLIKNERPQLVSMPVQ